jgi:predicted GIY-YIG superfamily endonuclease
VELVYSERIGGKGDALRRELAIKALTHSQKLALINQEENGRN